MRPSRSSSSAQPAASAEPPQQSSPTKPIASWGSDATRIARGRSTPRSRETWRGWGIRCLGQRRLGCRRELGDPTDPARRRTRQRRGVIIPQRRTTTDGFELNFAVHHLAPFAITSRLLALLRAGTVPNGPAGRPLARVININSAGHHTSVPSRRGVESRAPRQRANAYATPAPTETPPNRPVCRS